MDTQTLQQHVNEMNLFAETNLHASCILKRHVQPRCIWFTAEKTDKTVILGFINHKGLTIQDNIPQRYFKSKRRYEEWKQNK